jgi:AraC-like DNA-binding protein
MKPVRRLLDNSSYVQELHGKIKTAISKRLQEMCSENPTRQLLSILDILVKLAASTEVKQLLSIKYTSNQTTNTRDTERIHKVFEFIMKNYTQEIYVPEVASMLNMCDASFSRYFKHHTRKTFSNYLSEIRISNACRVLMQGEENISQIGYMCGFENLSNFYRHFKRITGLVPKDYRNRFLKIAQ